MKILFSLFLYFVLASTVLAQTEQTTAGQSVTQVNYSESQSYQPREFPATKNSKSKKEEKSKENGQTTYGKPDISSQPSKIDEAITIPVSVFDSKGRFVSNEGSKKFV